MGLNLSAFNFFLGYTWHFHYHLTWKNIRLAVTGNFLCHIRICNDGCDIKELQVLHPTLKQPPEVFCRKSCSQNLRNIHRKTPVLETLFNKAAGLGLQFYRKEIPTQVFSCKYFEIFKNTYFEERLLMLPLMFCLRIINLNKSFCM